MYIIQEEGSPLPSLLEFEIYTETLRDESEKSEENFPLHPVLRISRWDNAFSKILELKASPVERSNCNKKTRSGEKGKAKKESRKKFLKSWFRLK